MPESGMTKRKKITPFHALPNWQKHDKDVVLSSNKAFVFSPNIKTASESGKQYKAGDSSEMFLALFFYCNTCQMIDGIFPLSFIILLFLFTFPSPLLFLLAFLFFYSYPSSFLILLSAF